MKFFTVSDLRGMPVAMEICSEGRFLKGLR
jgi:hypothetical protein